MLKLNQDEQLQTLTEALAKGISELFKERSGIVFSKEPKIKKENIIEFNRRMRVFGLEKFESPTYVSTVNYYANSRDMQKGQALGALVVFVEQEYIAYLLQLLKYPAIDETKEDAMLDACGTLANIVAGRFKSEMLKLGLVKLEMSAFSNYRNSAQQGVAFNPKQHTKYEISFYLEGAKRLVVELTMGSVPQKNNASAAKGGSMAFEFDTAAVSDKLHISKEVYEKILKNSFETTGKDLADIQAALSSQDYESVQKIAHRLKGIYSNLRVEKLQIPAGQIELAVKEDKDKTQIPGHLSKFEEYFIQLKSFFNGKR